MDESVRPASSNRCRINSMRSLSPKVGDGISPIITRLAGGTSLYFFNFFSNSGSSLFKFSKLFMRISGHNECLLLKTYYLMDIILYDDINVVSVHTFLNVHGEEKEKIEQKTYRRIHI